MAPSADGSAGTRRPWSGQSGWHVADWGWWGWAETAIKLVAIVVAMVAAVDAGAWSVPDGHRLSYWLLVAVAVGYIGTVVDRLQDREVVAMVFVGAMVVGHWSLVFAMGRPDWAAMTVRAFVGLMLVGDLVKVGFFVVSGARVRGLPRAVPVVMTAGLVAVYAVALIAA